MQDTCLAELLGERIRLSDAERAAVRALPERGRALRRGGVLVRENDPISEIFVVETGMVMSYLLLDDGSRQILRFHFRGDLVGLPALAYRRSPETIAAVSEATVCPIDRAAFGRFTEAHPRLGALIMALHQMERVALTDRLADIGRASARGRVAALLLELRDKLRRDARAIVGGFALGITQEEIGDATGLTAVHVNRMLRRLEEEGLIRRDAGRVTLLDEAALARAANYVDRLAGLDFSWLPPAR